MAIYRGARVVRQRLWCSTLISTPFSAQKRKNKHCSSRTQSCRMRHLKRVIHFCRETVAGIQETVATVSPGGEGVKCSTDAARPAVGS